MKGLNQRERDCGGIWITGDTTLSGLMRVVVIGSQGSSFLATLGWLIQSRWDWAVASPGWWRGYVVEWRGAKRTP